MRRVAVADATRALRCPGWHERPLGVLVDRSLVQCEAAFSEGSSADPSKRRVHVAPRFFGWGVA
eukprot:1105413-Prymnesium_polylepis.1